MDEGVPGDSGKLSIDVLGPTIQALFPEAQAAIRFSSPETAIASSSRHTIQSPLDYQGDSAHLDDRDGSQDGHGDKPDESHEYHDDISVVECVLTSLFRENTRLKMAIDHLEKRPVSPRGKIGISRRSNVDQQRSEMDPNGSSQPPKPFLLGLHSKLLPPHRNAELSSSPFDVTRNALLQDLAQTQRLITKKNTELKPVRAHGPGSHREQPMDKMKLDKDLNTVIDKIATLRQEISVLREFGLIVQNQNARLDERLAKDTAALKELLGKESQARREINAMAIQDALDHIKGYIDNMLKTYVQHGTLPSPPLNPPPITLPPPPSAFPKKRGRPRKSIQNQVVPPELFHLVPPKEEVLAAGQVMLLRRKGVKRSREELEKEKELADKYGERLRGYIGVSLGRGWTGDGLAAASGRGAGAEA